MDKSLIEMLDSMSDDEFVSFIMQCADAMSTEELNTFLTDILDFDSRQEIKEEIKEIVSEDIKEEEKEDVKEEIAEVEETKPEETEEKVEEVEESESEDNNESVEQEVDETESIQEEVSNEIEEEKTETEIDNEEIKSEIAEAKEVNEFETAPESLDNNEEKLDSEVSVEKNKKNLQSQIKAKLLEVFSRNKKAESDILFEKQVDEKNKPENRQQEPEKEITYIDLDEIDEKEVKEYNEEQADNIEDYVDFEIENLDIKHKISYIRNRGKLLHLKKGLVIKKRKRNMVHTMLKNGPERYIDPICVDFCKKLWDKNVYTKDVIVNDKKVVIVLDKLSDENKALYEFSKNTSLINNDDKYIISIDREGRSDLLIKNMLSKTVNRFSMQDVTCGYLEKEKFLMHFCNCEKVDGLSENSDNKNIKIIFDENKMEKTFEEYLKEKNLDKLYSKDNDRIYIDEYYLNGHLRYLEYIKDRQ